MKNSVKDVSDQRAVDAFISGLHHPELIEEMGHNKQRRVSELMDIANKFADGKDTYKNMRMRSPKNDSSNRYSNQKRRPRNYEGYSSHSEVAAGYRGDNNNQGEEHQSSGYHNDDRDESGPSKPYKFRASREYNQSHEDILNGPCNMHYTFIDGRRASNHKMKDCQTFIELHEAVGSKQSKAQSQGYTGTPRSVAYNAPPPPPPPNNGAAPA
jgi:hypothetical protein